MSSTLSSRGAAGRSIRTGRPPRLLELLLDGPGWAELPQGHGTDVRWESCYQSLSAKQTGPNVLWPGEMALSLYDVTRQLSINTHKRLCLVAFAFHHPRHALKLAASGMVFVEVTEFPLKWASVTETNLTVFQVCLIQWNTLKQVLLKCNWISSVTKTQVQTIQYMGRNRWWNKQIKKELSKDDLEQEWILSNYYSLNIY